MVLNVWIEIQYLVKKKRWDKRTPLNFDVRTSVLKKKVLLQHCNKNRHHEIQHEKCQ
jgi:hypothetical protein